MGIRELSSSHYEYNPGKNFHPIKNNIERFRTVWRKRTKLSRLSASQGQYSVAFSNSKICTSIASVASPGTAAFRLDRAQQVHLVQWICRQRIDYWSAAIRPSCTSISSASERLSLCSIDDLGDQKLPEQLWIVSKTVHFLSVQPSCKQISFGLSEDSANIPWDSLSSGECIDSSIALLDLSRREPSRWGLDFCVVQHITCIVYGDRIL
jgi:hypothetical protein